MWARVVEFMLACWLAISPFVFRHEASDRFLWGNDLRCAALVAFFALTSFHGRLRRIHLCHFLVVAWLLGISFAQTVAPPPPAYQNYVVVGLLLMMFAIIPSRANVPPAAWADYDREHPA
jgi:hypothetical protein